MDGAEKQTNETSAAPAASESSTADIWAMLLAKKAAEANDEENDSLREASLVFVGPRESGKSSLIQSYMFKEKEDTPKPTTSLDYKYTRSSVGMSMDKDLSHFWELGGGRKLVSLLDICITPQNLQHAFAVITVDLSKPSFVVENLTFWLKAVKDRVKACCAKLTSSGGPGADLPRRCKELQLEQFGKDHEDLSTVSVCCVPILIVANKFDLVRDTEGELLKVLARTLRCIAHSHGASLIYTARRHKASQATFRSRISRHVLNKPPNKQLQVDPTEPLHVPAGMDSFGEIGLPPDASSAVSSVQAWSHAFSKYFPPNDKDKEAELTLDSLQLAPEPTVDQLLKEKDEDLKQVKRQMQLKRRMKQADNQAAAEFGKRS